VQADTEHAGDALDTLRYLAQGAVGHALRVCQLELCDQRPVDERLRDVDRILDGLRESPPVLPIQQQPTQQKIVQCYAAWLGMQLLTIGDARWIGLRESLPPRVLIAGRPVSPFDAVQHRLTSADAASLQELWKTAQAWAAENITDSWSAAKVDAHNRAAWDALDNDPRFAGADQLPPDQSSALAAIDPTIRQHVREGCRLLCLAAGGGRQGPLHALAGAKVTVVDASEKQLRHDRRAVARRGLPLQTIRASMIDLRQLEDATFDVVVQPVSTCYVRDLAGVYAEVARVLKPGGLYLVQHKQPQALLSRWNGTAYETTAPAIGSTLASPTDDPSATAFREAQTMEFAHSHSQLIGGLCAAGFQIEAFDEPVHGDAWAAPGTPGHRHLFLSPYLRITARRQTSG